MLEFYVSKNMHRKMKETAKARGKKTNDAYREAVAVYLYLLYPHDPDPIVEMDFRRKSGKVEEYDNPVGLRKIIDFPKSD